MSCLPGQRRRNSTASQALVMMFCRLSLMTTRTGVGKDWELTVDLVCVVQLRRGNVMETGRFPPGFHILFRLISNPMNKVRIAHVIVAEGCACRNFRGDHVEEPQALARLDVHCRQRPLSGLRSCDQRHGGIVDLGYNPAVPLSFDAAPGRFLSGILLYGAIMVSASRWFAKRRG